jgi:signal transduction histidine kinase
LRDTRLSTRLLIAAAMTLLLFLLASFGVFYRAQSRYAVRDMDQLLQSEAFALSTLVDINKAGKLDFELSPLLLAHYQKTNAKLFFRFFLVKESSPLQESLFAPPIGCDLRNNPQSVYEGAKTYRAYAYSFQPGFEDGATSEKDTARPWVCIVVGVDQAPYTGTALRSTLSSLPYLIVLFIFALLIFFFLIGKLTSDLTRLKSALKTADFDATHAFPQLPEATTPEVRAVVSMLETLHLQAASSYGEMWLFLGRAAHQLKTPITGVQATLEVLLRKERTREELLATLVDLEHGVMTLSKLTQKLISSSRLGYEKTEATRISLNTFFSELLPVFHVLAERRGILIQIRTQFDLEIHANSSLLTEIFGNLIDNAIQYTQKNTEITIDWIRDGRYAKISVLDQGKGIPTQVKDRLFEPFVRGDERSVSGSGLGLSIAKKAALLSDGDLVLAESSSQGSRFTVVLPLS